MKSSPTYRRIKPFRFTVEGLTGVGTVTKTVTEEAATEEETQKLLKKSGEPPGTRTQGPRLKRETILITHPYSPQQVT